jgi:hypothetical protein
MTESRRTVNRPVASKSDGGEKISYGYVGPSVFALNTQLSTLNLIFKGRYPIIL